MRDLARQPRRVASPEEDVDGFVDRARACDPNAWEVLYRRAYPRLLAYARRRLDVERAHDAVSEAMARAVAGISGFEGRGAGFDAWLFGILRYVVLDAHRARRRESHEQPTDDPSLERGPLEHVLADEESVALRAAFARLGPDDRELLELRVVAGLSSEDVARVLGKRPGAIRMAQARALERLRKHLDASR